MVPVAVALFAIFPLTDTDIWWHLACAREWVTTWTPVREPVVNVHEYFQQMVAFVYDIGGAPLLVAFKALLWGVVFMLFLLPSIKKNQQFPTITFAGIVVLLFVFRYQLEIRPVLLSMLFLGVYWNVLPWLFYGWREDRKADRRADPKKFHHVFHLTFRDVTRLYKFLGVLLVLFIQWVWCKCQGLYILGIILAYGFFSYSLWFRRWVNFGKVRQWNGVRILFKTVAWQTLLVILLFATPFLHHDGFNLIPYPFELFDRLLGLSPSATVFASEIAENRSPITLLLNGENVLQSALMLVFSVMGIVLAAVRWHLEPSPDASWQLSWQTKERVEAIFNRRLLPSWLFITAILSLIAERNFVLFLPVFVAVVVHFSVQPSCSSQKFKNTSLKLKNTSLKLKNSSLKLKKHLAEKSRKLGSKLKLKGKLAEKTRNLSTTLSPLLTSELLLSAVVLAFVLGLWGKSLSSYDSMIAYQRVPVGAAHWMMENPHPGRLFNDDRSGGYLAYMNPLDSTYIDGRFILKTADFFERYLTYARMPKLFLVDADSLDIDRVVLPLRYYARWDKLIETLDSSEKWHVAYRDSLFVVMDRTLY
ncbi:putative membrane protein [Fibrobacter succinogenes subsp. succinogenes S85]|uniref:Putative membrane protein n=1 Tax=Fibrobacter succinogenes (strain ATCC 19169 / S85) TaxID=59374 RepID=D9S8D9_FIBSS|nr:putative membrane protein [Fibrobacter succinogenes subsp. succinogenes S85]